MRDCINLMVAGMCVLYCTDEAVRLYNVQCTCTCTSVPQVSYGDEKFPPREQGPVVATPTADLLKRAGFVAQVYIIHVHIYHTISAIILHIYKCMYTMYTLYVFPLTGATQSLCESAGAGHFTGQSHTPRIPDVLLSNHSTFLTLTPFSH